MRSIALVLAAVIVATAASAAQNGKGPQGRNAPQSGGNNAVGVVVRGGGVNLTVQKTIRDYYADKPQSARPLPPGVAKNYVRGRKLPPGIAKRPLPPDLARRLPVQPGYQYIVVDSDVLLIVVATGIVADVLIDVL